MNYSLTVCMFPSNQRVSNTATSKESFTKLWRTVIIGFGFSLFFMGCQEKISYKKLVLCQMYILCYIMLCCHDSIHKMTNPFIFHPQNDKIESFAIHPLNDIKLFAIHPGNDKVIVFHPRNDKTLVSRPRNDKALVFCPGNYKAFVFRPQNDKALVFHPQNAVVFFSEQNKSFLFIFVPIRQSCLNMSVDEIQMKRHFIEETYKWRCHVIHEIQMALSWTKCINSVMKIYKRSSVLHLGHQSFYYSTNKCVNINHC